MSIDELIAETGDTPTSERSALDHRPTPDPVRGTAIEHPLRAGWATLPALVTSVAIALLVGDATRAVFVAASTAAVVTLAAIVALHTRRLPTRLLVVAGAVLGCLGGIGVALTGDTDSSIGFAARLGVIWGATIWIATSPARRSATSTAETKDARRRDRRCELVMGAAGLSAAVSIAALMAGGLRRNAAVAAVAVPIALALFWVAESSLGSRGSLRSRWTSPSIASVAGIAAAIATAAEMPRDVSRPTLVALASVAVVVAVVATVIVRRGPIVRRLPSTQRDRMPIAAITLVVLALTCGAGATALTVTALAIAVIAASTSEERRVAAPAPSRTTSTRVVGALTVVGFLLRTFTHRGLWLDETTSVFQARMPFFDMIRFIGRTDNHPPLHHILLWADIRLVGDSEFALRLPMMVMGAALIPMAFLIGREFFDRRVGVYAAALTTVAPIAVWYGQEARMYSQFMLLAAISVYALARILNDGSRRYWVVFTISSVALVYTQYFAVLHVAGTIVVLAIEILRRRRNRTSSRLLRSSLASIAGQVVLLAPLVPYAISQALRNQDEGFGFSTAGVAAGSAVVPPPGIYGFLTNLQWVFFGYLPDDVSVRLVALWPVGLLIGLLLLGTQRRTANRILLTIAGIPMLAIFSASFIAAQSRSLAEVRYFAGAVPVLLVLLAAGIVAIARSVRLQYVTVGAVVALMSVALVVQQFDRDNPRRYDYQQAVEQVRRDASPGDTVLYAPEYFDYTLDYYDPTIPSRPLADGLPTADDHSVFIIEAASFADSSQATDLVRTAIDDLAARGMSVEEQYRFAQVTVWKIGAPS